MTKYTIFMFNVSGPLEGKEPLCDSQKEVFENLSDAQVFADGQKTKWKYVTIHETSSTKPIEQFINGKKQRSGSPD